MDHHAMIAQFTRFAPDSPPPPPPATTTSTDILDVLDYTSIPDHCWQLYSAEANRRYDPSVTEQMHNLLQRAQSLILTPEASLPS